MEWPEEMIWKSRFFCSIKSKQGRVGQGTKKNYRAAQDTGYQNSTRAGYRLQKYLNLQSSRARPVSVGDDCNIFTNIYDLSTSSPTRLLETFN
jgi:hypothetical protein